MNIRPLRVKDINAAAAIVGANYNKQFECSAAKELRAMFENKPIRPVYFVAEERGRIVGFAGYTQSWMDYNVYELFWVNVLPSRHRQGIGKNLVRHVIARIKRRKNACVILLTADSQKTLPKYYARLFGFRSLQRFSRKTYHLMALPLEKASGR